MGSLTDPQWKGSFGGQTPQPKHAVANCCCHLANRRKRFRLLPNYVGACFIYVLRYCKLRKAVNMLAWEAEMLQYNTRQELMRCYVGGASCCCAIVGVPCCRILLHPLSKGVFALTLFGLKKVIFSSV